MRVGECHGRRLGSVLPEVVARHVLKVPTTSSTPEIKQAWNVTQTEI